MYRRIIGRALVALFFSTVLAVAAPVDKSTARKALKGWMRSETTKMGVDVHNKNIEETQTYLNDTGDAIFHVISFSTGGYAVLSTDDTIEPVIAFSADGAFTADLDNPLYALLLADMDGRLQTRKSLTRENAGKSRQNAASRKRQRYMEKKSVRWKKLTESESMEFAEASTEASASSIDDVRVNTLVSTRWNQSNPEDEYTPNGYVCGCVATAMSQLMRFHQHPTAGIGARSNTIKVDDVSQTATTRGGDGVGGPYNWAGMPDYPGGSDVAVGALTSDAGISVGMSYTSSSSGVDTGKAASAFTGWFGYSSAKRLYASGTATEDQIHKMVNANLDASCPVLFGVQDSSDGGGHAIVCDGYGYNSSVPYHHLNMGWAGSYDAWYNLPNIDSGFNSYDSVYKIVYNVFPDAGGAIISGRVLDSTGSPLGGVVVAADNGAQVYTDTTDSKGIYALVHVPSGTYSIEVVDDTMTSETMSATVGTTTSIDWCPNHWGIDLMVSDAIVEADEDAYVLSTSASANFGSEMDLAVQDDSGSTVYESFIKFDLSSITDTVETAQLRLKVEENGAHAINEVYVMSDDTWTEGGITYNNRPTVGQMIYELLPAFVPAAGDSTLLIGGALNNGNLDDDSVVTDLSGTTWYQKDADLRYYIASESDGSGYYSGWTLSRSGSYPGGNNVIGMLTYAHPTMYDSGTTPDFGAFANTGGVQIQSDPVSATLTVGNTLTATFKASTHSATASFSGSAVFIFDEGLSGETTVTATPVVSTPFTLVTYNGSDTSYMGAFTAQCDVPGSCSTVSLRVGVRNSTSSVGCSLDDVELALAPTGAVGEERWLCVNVGPAVVSELAGDGVVTFCLRGDSGLASYCSSESDATPKLVLSGHAEADSVADWEADSTQPDGQWTYGTYGVGADFTTFAPYTVRASYYGGTQSWIGGNGEIWDWSEGYPRVGKYATAPYGGTAHPTLENMESVKRWTSNIKGVVTALIGVQQIQDSVDGDIITVRKNGVDLWSQNLDSNYRASKVLEIGVYPGDVIDFAVDPVGNGNADWCYLRVRITSKTPTANRAGLQAHYDFDEASDMPTDADGDQYDRKMYAYDFSGNSRFATLKNCDTWTVWKAGQIGNAIDLDGVNDYVASSVQLSPAVNACSVAAWIKGGAANDVLISQSGSQNWIGLNASGQLTTGIMPSGGSALSASTAWDAANWHHVVMVWDGARRYLYVDGVEVAGDAVDLSAPVSASGVLNVGVDSALANAFDGMVDDLGIWSRALPAKEIAVLYEAGLAGDTLAFAHSEPIDPGLDLVIVDLNATSYNYDFGPTASPVMSGWTAITDNTGGDISWSGTVDSRDRGNPGGINDINRDFVFNSSAATLEHKIANGDWHVTLNMGDVDFAHDDMVVKAEGITMDDNVDSAASAFPYVIFDANVTDGYLSIELSDAGGTDPSWVVTRMSLTLNTNAPPVATGDTVSVAENSPAGTVAGVVTVSDPGDTFTFAITAGNGSGLFAIDGSGNVTTTGPLDYETATQHVLTVTVTDSGSLTDTATVTVNVTDVAENVPPVASGDTVSVAESAPAGTAAGTVTVSDPGDTFTFAITAGNSSGLFAIDGSGNVTTTGPLDYETATQHVLTVTVTDSGSLTDTATVTVNVTDVAENVPPIATGETVNVAENGSAGEAAGTVTVNDPGDTFTFAITAGNSSGLFAIASSGSVATTGPLDYETATQYVLTVTVTDSGSLTDTATVTVNVTDVIESANPDIRVTEYYLTTGDFSGTTATVTLDQDLAPDYYILVRGSRDGDGKSLPDNDYARVLSVPGGKGDLSASGASNQIVLQRQAADFDWEGVVTVVECQDSTSTSGFKLLDAVVTAMSATSGTDSSVAWVDLSRVVLFGGYRGGGVELFGNPSARKQGTGCYVRLYPSGTGTINWARDAGGETMYDATMTTFVVEWGSDWTVQHVNVAGNNGGNGTNVTGEYTTAAIGAVARDNSWVWATGTRIDSGIGDCSESCLVTIGDGVNQNVTESSVAIGSEYTDAYDFDVYVMTHSDLAVDHRFKADGDQNVLDLAVTVDSAAVGARFGWSYNGVNGTGDYFPRPRMWARYTSDTTVTISRGYDGQNYPAWVQGIDFSGVNQ